MNAQDLLDKAMRLWKYCTQDDFNQKEFKSMMDKFNLVYKRCNVDVQGEYHELFARAMK